MKTLNKSILYLSLLSVITISHADNTAKYQVMYGPKEISGENIHFEKTGKWIKAPALVSAWTDVGSPTGCSSWTPDPSTVATGVGFEQSSTNCTQNQTRTIQEREQNDYTNDYRNIGAAKTENQTLSNYTIKRNAVGTKIVEDCGDGSMDNYRWVAGTPSYRIFYIIWGGQKIVETGEYDITEKTVNGYLYKKRNLSSNYGTYSFSTLCRTPI